jgi:hypothetical protein
MRRLVVPTVLALSLALPASALALNLIGGSDDGTLSLKGGVGKVGLSFNGSIVGRIAHGRVVLTDPILSDGGGVVTWGCDRIDMNWAATTTYCSGNNLRFRAIGGKYLVAIRGSGIYLSAVGHGSVALDGRGDNPAVAYDGVYSLNDGAYRSLPDYEQKLQLAAPAGG